MQPAALRRRSKQHASEVVPSTSQASSVSRGPALDTAHRSSAGTVRAGSDPDTALYGVLAQGRSTAKSLRPAFVLTLLWREVS
jgi:hypothetical protein